MKCDMCGDEGVICGYGFFLGGDPRDFSPDVDSCTPAELKAHEEACARWNAGTPKDEGHSGIFVGDPEKGVAAIVCGHRFGIGTYTMPCDCKKPPGGAGGRG